MPPPSLHKKKIYLLFRGAFPEGSGATDRIRVLAQTLTELGFQVHLLLSREYRISKQAFPYTIHYWGEPEISRSGWWQKWQHERSCNRKLIRLLKSEPEPGIIWIYHPDLLFHSSIIRWAKLHQWECWGEQTELNTAVVKVPEMQQNRLYYWLAKLNELVLPFLFKKWMVISKVMQQHYGPKTELLGLLLPPHMPAPDRQNPSYKWGFTGSFGHKDGLPFLLASFQLARQEIPALKLVLTGDCPHPENLREQISKAGLPATAVTFTGFLERTTLLRELHTCDGLLITRPDDAYALAGFPQKLATYLEAGRPIVSTYYESISELPGANCCPYGDKESLASMIIQAYNDWGNWENKNLLFREAAREKFNSRKSLLRVLGLIDNQAENN